MGFIEKKCRKTEEDKWGDWISPKKMDILMRPFYPKERMNYVNALQKVLDNVKNKREERKNKDTDDDA